MQKCIRCCCAAGQQEPVAYARVGGGFGGQTPPLTIGKNQKPLFLDRLAFFHTEIVFFCAVSNCLYNLEKLSLRCNNTVVKLFWCVALEPMAGSKCKPGQGQWALKLESCCDLIIILNSYRWTKQRFSAEGIVGREWLQRLHIFRLRCHDFEPNRPVGEVVKHIDIGAGGFGFGFFGRYRPLAQLLSAQVIGTENPGFDSRDGQIGTVLPTARHRCDVSVLPKR